MCASCGCGKAEDKHGDERNIKLSDIEAAAKAAKTDVSGVIENLREAAAQGSSGKSSN